MIYHVNAKAFRDGDGSEQAPFKRISDAAALALPGDEVLVYPGTYREHVIPAHAGTKKEPVVYRSVEKGKAVITGAEKITSWKKYKGSVWVARIPNEVFGTYNPYIEEVCGDWYFAPDVRHTGSVYINDRMLYEVNSLKDCQKAAPGKYAWYKEDSTWQWYTEQDEEKNETVIYANFHDEDPNKENTEILVRRNCFMPDKNGVSYITVSGFKICKAATTWAPPAAYQDGMIGPHWSKGWIIEDCEVCDSRCCGISLGKYYDPENDMYFFHKHVKSPTQMERDAVCRGQFHGWVKEKVGSHIVRRCHIHDCGQTGIVGRMGAVFSVIEDCDIHHCCTTAQLGGAETAGIKLHAGIDVTIRRNHIHDNIMGIWLDWEAQGARITQNLLHDNNRPKGVEQAPGAMFNTDVFIEVGHGPTLIDNNLLLSPVSVTIPSEGIAVLHNLILGSFSLINSGVDSVINGQREPRYTPYHIRHRTEVAGFMTILHGDDRIYNNIFVQQYPITDKKKTPQDADYQAVGTAPFDIFPTEEAWKDQFDLQKHPDMGKLAEAHFGHLPVWVEGNAYFNGASVSKHEKNGFQGGKTKVTVELKAVKEKGSILPGTRWVLKTDLYGALKKFGDELLHTSTLGCAFEPEQAFENPDGTPITFDRDYFGDRRTLTVLPGPFGSAAGAKELTVWQ